MPLFPARINVRGARDLVQLGTAAPLLLEEDVEIAPSSHTRVKVPAKFSWEGAGAGVRALLVRGVVDYELNTKLRIEASLGARDMSFQSRGEVSISDLVP